MATKGRPQPNGDGSATDDGLDERISLVRAYGMFWLRESVSWEKKPALWGRQAPGANKVDFNAQLGVYILYDGRDPIYVGRTTDRPLGQRLLEHTQDRLRSRWNRFSWFGTMDVSDDGQLRSTVASPSVEHWIITMESLLIEALEPPQNRKRGDGFSAIEYMQAEDPTISKRTLLEGLLEDLRRSP